MEREIGFLSDDQLDEVVGGMSASQQAWGAFWDGFDSTAGQAAKNMMQGSFTKAQAAAGQ